MSHFPDLSTDLYTPTRSSSHFWGRPLSHLILDTTLREWGQAILIDVAWGRIENAVGSSKKSSSFIASAVLHLSFFSFLLFQVHRNTEPESVSPLAAASHSEPFDVVMVDAKSDLRSAKDSHHALQSINSESDLLKKMENISHKKRSKVLGPSGTGQLDQSLKSKTAHRSSASSVIWSPTLPTKSPSEAVVLKYLQGQKFFFSECLSKARQVSSDLSGHIDFGIRILANTSSPQNVTVDISNSPIRTPATISAETVLKNCLSQHLFSLKTFPTQGQDLDIRFQLNILAPN